jgi:hypothetical protein
MNKLHFKQPLVAGFLAITLLLISSQIAYAHDGFSKQIIEGTFERLDLEINHGCAGNPVIAQTVLFPTLNPELSAYDSSNNPVTPPNDLAEVSDNGNLEGQLHLIQDRSIFLDQDQIVSELGNPIGFYGKNGFLKANLLGSVPFKFFGVFFTPTTCYKHINVVTAIADICSTKPPVLASGKVSLFIPDNGSQIGETAKSLGNEHGVGEPSIMHIDRNLETNPFLDAEGNPTTACGDGITVTVTPSAEDMDANFKIPGYWPLNSQKDHHKDHK